MDDFGCWCRYPWQDSSSLGNVPDNPAGHIRILLKDPYCLSRPPLCVTYNIFRPLPVGLPSFLALCSFFLGTEYSKPRSSSVAVLSFGITLRLHRLKRTPYRSFNQPSTFLRYSIFVKPSAHKHLYQEPSCSLLRPYSRRWPLLLSFPKPQGTATSRISLAVASGKSRIETRYEEVTD